MHIVSAVWIYMNTEQPSNKLKIPSQKWTGLIPFPLLTVWFRMLWPIHILKLIGTIRHKKELSCVEVWFCLYFSFFLVVWSLSKHPYPPRIYAYKQGCANRFWAEYVNIRSAAKTITFIYIPPRNCSTHYLMTVPYVLVLL